MKKTIIGINVSVIIIIITYFILLNYTNCLVQIKDTPYGKVFYPNLVSKQIEYINSSAISLLYDHKGQGSNFSYSQLGNYSENRKANFNQKISWYWLESNTLRETWYLDGEFYNGDIIATRETGKTLIVAKKNYKNNDYRREEYDKVFDIWNSFHLEMIDFIEEIDTVYKHKTFNLNYKYKNITRSVTKKVQSVFNDSLSNLVILDYPIVLRLWSSVPNADLGYVESVLKENKKYNFFIVIAIILNLYFLAFRVLNYRNKCFLLTAFSAVFLFTFFTLPSFNWSALQSNWWIFRIPNIWTFKKVFEIDLLSGIAIFIISIIVIFWFYVPFSKKAGKTIWSIVFIIIFPLVMIINSSSVITLNNLWFSAFGFVAIYLMFFINFILNKTYAEERSEQTQTLLLNKATQTAAVAISARNLSHITGSHVIPWLNAKLREWQETQPDITEYKKMEQVNRHIMERMDLIAEMSTAEPAFRTNMPLTEVLNYLQENKDAYTIYPGWFIKSLLKQNQKINLLTIPEKIDDYYWASPGDVFGKQAFSILIEGFIRNVVKHENPNEDIKIIFSITVPDANDMTINPNDYWCIDLVYNSENNRKDKEQFLNEIKETTGNTLIDNKTYNLEYTGWGLKEMLIAAAYLRMIPIVNIYSINEILNPNFYNIEGTIIKTLIPDNENGKLFGYRFFIYKSKFCTFYEIDNADSLTNRFANNGVSINDKANSNDYEYRIEILSKNSHGKKVINNSNQKVLFVNNTDEIKTLLESESYEKFSSDIGIKWNVEAKNSGYFQSMPTLIGYTNNNNESINYHILKKEDENAIAFFDNHGGFYKYLSNSCQNGKTAIESIKDRVFKDLKIREVGNYDFYYESYGSSSLTSNLILQKKYSILQESVCTKILIVDERIQDYVFNEKDNNTKIPLSEIFEGMNISVPSPKEFDLRIVQENLLDSIDKAYKLDDYHYIVIHMTIIEKNFRKTDKKALSSHITEEMNRYKGKVTLVITSGRGRPSNLPEDSFFIPYSTIQNYCLYSRSKAGLVKSLHSIRRKKV